MREQFEKLPEIAERLKVGDVYWNEDTQSYKFTGGTYRRATFINGALYAFQEQQKRIDDLIELMNEYYTGSFSTIEELAGEISAALTGTED